MRERLPGVDPPPQRVPVGDRLEAFVAPGRFVEFALDGCIVGRHLLVSGRRGIDFRKAYCVQGSSPLMLEKRVSASLEHHSDHAAKSKVGRTLAAGYASTWRWNIMVESWVI